MTAETQPPPASPSESESIPNLTPESSSAAPSAPEPPHASTDVSQPSLAPAAEQPSEDPSTDASKPRIKIGTQRPGVAVPRIEPRAKVAFHTQPSLRQPVDRPPPHEQLPAQPPSARTAQSKGLTMSIKRSSSIKVRSAEPRAQTLPLIPAPSDRSANSSVNCRLPVSAVTTAGDSVST